jgi:hypothetical protein
MVLATADGRMVALQRAFFATAQDWAHAQDLAVARVREVR